MSDDFGMVREGLGPWSAEKNEFHAALDRIQAEVERLRAYETAVKDFWVYVRGAPIEALEGSEVIAEDNSPR